MLITVHTNSKQRLMDSESTCLRMGLLLPTLKEPVRTYSIYLMLKILIAWQVSMVGHVVVRQGPWIKTLMMFSILHR